MKYIGRPPKFTDPAELQKLADQYFEDCDKNPIRVERHNKRGELVVAIKAQPYTVAGFALALGFNSRQSLLNYCGYRDEERTTEMTEEEKNNRKMFVDIILRGKAKIEIQNLKMAQVGEFEPKITALNLSANYDYATKAEDKLDTNWSINFTNAEEKGQDK